MAAINLYLEDVLASNSAHMRLQRDGTAPTTATTGTGWTVAKIASGNYARMDSQTERTSGSFSTTAQPNGAPDNTLGDCFRSAATLSGDFDSGTWTLAFPVIAVSGGNDQDGAIRIRLWRSVNEDGSSATEITSATQEGSGVTNLTTAAAQTSTVSFNPGAFSLNNEYLFVQVAWRITGAGANNNRDVLLRVGSAAVITTANFVDAGQDVTLPLLSAPATLNAPSLVLNVTLPLLAAGATLFAPTVAPDQNVTLPLLSASATLNTPTIGPRPAIAAFGASYTYGLEGTPRLTTTQPYRNDRAVNTTDDRAGNPSAALNDLIPHVDLEDPGSAMCNQLSQLGVSEDLIFHDRASAGSAIWVHTGPTTTPPNGGTEFIDQMGQVDDVVTLVGAAQDVVYIAIFAASLGWVDEVTDATPWATYEDALLETLADYRSELTSRTGQTFQPRLYTQQPGWWNAVGDATNREPPLDYAFNFLALAQSNPDIVIVSSTNWMQIGADDIHPTNTAYQVFGEQVANVIYLRHVLGIAWLPLHMTAAETGASNTVRLSYHIPAVAYGFDTGAALVLDTDASPSWRTDAASSTTHGFRYIPNGNPARNITSVAIEGEQVVITLDGAPAAGALIGYADFGAAPPNQPRGNLRDNWDQSQMPAGQSQLDYPLWNWAVAQQVTITAAPQDITLPLLSAPATLNAPSLVLNVSLPLLSAPATLSAPTVTPGAVDVTLPLLSAPATLFASSLVLNVTLPLLDATATLSAPTVTQSGGTQNVTLPLLSAGATLFTPELELNVTLPLLSASASLFGPSLSLEVSLPLLNAGATLNAPTVSVGAVDVTLPLLSAPATLSAPAISLEVTLPLLSASATLSSPTVDPGAVNVSLPFLSAPATLSAPELEQNVQLPLLNAAATLSAPTVTTGSVNVTLPLLNASATLDAPTVSQGLSLVLPLLNAGATLNAPELELEVTLPLLSASATLLVPHVEPVRPIGFNLDFVYDTACWSFANRIRHSNGFHSGSVDVWDDGRPLTIDSDGYPTSLLVGPPAQQAITLFATNNRAHQFELTWDGNGTIQLSQIQSIDQTGPGNYILFTASASESHAQLRITAVGSPHITNIDIRRVGETEADFDSDFLSNFDHVVCIRFMQWMMTNEVGGSTNDVEWVDRHQPNWFYQQGRAAWERCIELCNRLQCDAWINIPVRASDDYCQQLGALWGANLDPNLRVRLELSNEVWNGAFGQWTYAVTQGQLQDLDEPGEDDFIAAMRWLGRRSVQTFREFEFGFNGGAAGRSNRVVRQVAGQIGFTYEFDRIFEGVDLEGDPLTEMDAVAVNPYVGAYLYLEPTYLQNSTPDTIFRRLRNDFWLVGSPPLATEMSVSKTIANTYNCELVAYEGGQHLAVYGADQNNAPLIANLVLTNRDPGMESIYQMLLNHWTSIGGGLFCHYTYTGTYNQFGTWGALEASDETGATADKYRALQDWSALSGVIVSPTPLIADATLHAFSLSLEVSLPLLSATATMFAPTVQEGTSSVELPFLSAGASLNAPTITTGVSLPLLSAPATLTAPEVYSGNLALPLLSAPATLNVPSLVVGPVSLSLPLLSAAATLFSSELEYLVRLPLLGASAILSTPTITTGGTTVLPPLLISSTSLYPPSLPSGPVQPSRSPRIVGAKETKPHFRRGRLDEE